VVYAKHQCHTECLSTKKEIWQVHYPRYSRQGTYPVSDTDMLQICIGYIHEIYRTKTKVHHQILSCLQQLTYPISHPISYSKLHPVNIALYSVKPWFARPYVLRSTGDSLRNQERRTCPLMETFVPFRECGNNLVPVVLNTLFPFLVPIDPETWLLSIGYLGR
jgi:hypothetical protein